MQVWPGAPAPLGVTYDGGGVNVAVYSSSAEKVEVCLFDDDGSEKRTALPERSGDVWHGYLPEVVPGTRYGLRVSGPFDPEQGHRANPNKLLLDPYARAIEGVVNWDEAVFGYPFAEGPDVRNDVDSAPFVPKAVVVDEVFSWEGDRLLRTPWRDLVIYEAHVKGATQCHPDIAPERRGTYLGIADPAFVGHLQALGVTALELLPVHQFIHDKHLLDQGLRNYWGYNSIGFFAPHNEYASSQRGQQVREFKEMVMTLHQAGIEVILDVVYNHTAEGNQYGPTLSMRGIDNPSYYRLVPGEHRYYMDYTGTGNSLNMRNPFTLQLVMDSLRYWVTEMHVDGFRFDLAAALARELHEVDRLSAFFDIIQQDPILSRVKLIAEPWDVGEGGYQVGNFPPQWAEWNGRYRDDVRDYWRGEGGRLGELAYRLTGSSDLYQGDSRRPHASINFVTAHDGFTLRDLVSFNEKHNLANGEEGRDGEDHNRSWNCGAEGSTDDDSIWALRHRQQRNLMATLLLSQGVPMLLGGDELGRTQKGNNNAYCQDNTISWTSWENVDTDLLAFAQRLVAFRRAHPAFRRSRFFQGRPLRGSGVTDIAWLSPDATEMTDEQWDEGNAKSLAVYLNGSTVDLDRRGEPINDDSFLLMLNAHSEPVSFIVPDARFGDGWTIALDTANDAIEADADELGPGARISVAEHSMVVLQAPADRLRLAR